MAIKAIEEYGLRPGEDIKIVSIDAFSGHADKHELRRYVENLRGNIKKIAVIHGEEAQSLALAHEAFEEGQVALKDFRIEGFDRDGLARVHCKADAVQCLDGLNPRPLHAEEDSLERAGTAVPIDALWQGAHAIFAALMIPA